MVQKVFRKIILPLVVFVLIPIVCAGAVYSLAQAYFPYRRTSVTNLASDKFGPTSPNLCERAGKEITTSLAPNPKFAIIDSDYRTVYEPYYNALPDDIAGKGPTDTTDMLCLSFGKRLFEDNYDCKLYRSDVEAYLIDSQSGATAVYRHILGPVPENCDSSGGHVEGDAPAAATVINWLQDVKRLNSAFGVDPVRRCKGPSTDSAIKYADNAHFAFIDPDNQRLLDKYNEVLPSKWRASTGTELT